ncbi:SDR family oxidoreductase [Catenulispora subtropica]|uniref:NAD(P)H-binding protein n=1 Tax=Catenulispora subtropica TaxID=450798 RepID=A0ABN2QLW4_9ACTN
MILVTGASGTLGGILVPMLAARGEQVRALSRRARDGAAGSCEWVVGDLNTGDGLDEAMAGVDVIVHAASNTRKQGKGDTAAAWHLIEAAKRGGRRPHLVYISIVGVDRHPLKYYRTKYEVEQAVEDSGLPYTILRTTQWFQLLDTFLRGAAKSPLLPVPSFPFQPLDAAEAAGRLAELAVGAPQGRAADLGGPELLPCGDLARTWLRATGKHRMLVPLRVPGKVGKAFRDGIHNTPDNRQGKATWAEYLAAAY